FDAREEFPAELFDSLAEETLKKCDMFNEEQLCIVTTIFSNYHGVEQCFEKIASRIVGKVENYTIKNISCISHSFSKVKVYHTELFTRIYRVARASIHGIKPSELATLIYSW